MRRALNPECVRSREKGDCRGDSRKENGSDDGMSERFVDVAKMQEGYDVIHELRDA